MNISDAGQMLWDELEEFCEDVGGFKKLDTTNEFHFYMVHNLGKYAIQLERYSEYCMRIRKKNDVLIFRIDQNDFVMKPSHYFNEIKATILFELYKLQEMEYKKPYWLDRLIEWWKNRKKNQENVYSPTPPSM